MKVLTRNGNTCRNSHGFQQQTKQRSGNNERHADDPPLRVQSDGKTMGKTMDKLRFQRIERLEPLQYLAHSKRRRRKQKGG
ncbi:MAG: hypothetical protein JSR95_00225 [Proteobacteria bacterium]|nr:hypothetical protein [Pseudomonadota bacterium]